MKNTITQQETVKAIELNIIYRLPDRKNKTTICNGRHRWQKQQY